MKILLFAIVFFMGMITPSVFAEENAPSWIKNTAGWWADNLINDNEFVNAIEFLIKEGIIKIDAKAASEKSDNIPDWIRNTAGWWATDQISETEFLNAIQFLIESGLINISSYNCDQSEDRDRNGVPDIIETAPVLSGLDSSLLILDDTEFANKNWSNCYFPKDLSHYTFRNSDLTNADFTDSKLFNSMFDTSNLQGADFSNTNIQGSLFFSSDLSHTNFENADFSTDNWEEPFLKFTYETHNDSWFNATTTFSCYYNPCLYHRMFHSGLDNEFYTQTFGENLIPLNLDLVDVITDKSDQRSIWRHYTAFIDSNITETIFTKSDLRYAKFIELDINNVDFTDADLSNTKFSKVNLNNVKPADNLPNGFIDAGGLLYPPNTELNTTDQYISNKKFTTLDDLDGGDFDIIFDSALDYPPINWSMGMTIYDEKLYVADTDNHRIIVYDLTNNEKLLTFTSPIQVYCLRSEVCALENRNLPTSIEIIGEKIFVAYGFQDEIQVFDLDGNYLWKFGSSGNQAGEFNTPHRLSAVNNELFVADSENHRIQVFDTDGNFLRQFGTHGDYVGQLNHPIDVHAYDSQIFVADSARASILVFDLNGKFMREFEVGQNTSDISTPYGVFVYDNLIFVSDVGDFSVKVFDIDGNLVKQFGQHGDRYGEFKFPLYTVTDGKKIFVSDAYNYRVQIFNVTS
uniref:Tripartite motif-containing protein 71 (TRIM71) n=2 Tax=environmental samples TaxID=651140 RepID=A0A075GPL9_9ARCH|nr:tripartite motif-containing protein 71 (TRIM71) [uncultured marine thaumarchaeote AD1000_80_F03]AIF04017.1 tripartite motif-containing protein 71 (TRIM71) [uncultured marine thaumarchaeote KM3_16_E08]